MLFKALFIGQLSASFELDNNDIYYAEKSFDVLLDGKIVLKDNKTNVFSIYGLEPDKEYKVSIDEDDVIIHTLPASMIVHVSEFKNESKSKDDTLMLQTAINVTKENGIVFVDKGEYHVTSLYMKSGITLYLEKGAVILGNTSIQDYPLIPGELKYCDQNKPEDQIGAWEGNPSICKTSIIVGYYLKDVTLDGEGIIDGQADKSDFWKDVKNLKWGRPRLVFFNQCENIVLHGLSFKNTPCWTIHPYFCSNVDMLDIKVSNPKDAPNTDGIDPECCSNVRVIGVYFSVGDDCIALKSGKMYIGQKYKKPCENVQIRNCYMHEGHGAIVLGSEIGAGVKNIKVERCFFEHTDRGFRIKTRRGRGKECVIDGVLFKDIIMDRVLTPLVINMFYFCDPDGKTEYVWSKKKLPVDDRTPYLGSFVFDNIKATNAEWALGWFYGLPEMPIKSITIRNSTFTVKEDATEGFPAMMSYIDKQSKAGFCFFNVEKVVLENVKASGYVGDEVHVENVTSLKEL